ncbi:MAG: ATP-binding cassette domain-containing protein, partial [Desulfovibrionales bacterium]|nr:ATP-binding cassette domain-containing protein [Desulfovibrionales bacterium]
MAVLLKAQDLTTNFYTYEGAVKALDKFNFSIDHGCTFGLVGESGCGKSVTVRSMMRVIQSPGVIEGGKVLFSEKAGAEPIDLLSLIEEEMEGIRGDSISMIFQEPNAALNPVITIGDQV